MAISRGAGTEIIRSAHFEDVNNTAETLILGKQHHIYTVLNIIFYCTAQNGTEPGYLSLSAYDSNAGTTAQNIYIAKISNSSNTTFVWNDKFSFNGFEPTDFAGPVDSDAKQDAIADQGSSVPQYLRFQTDGASTLYDITVTYIDQNNA